MMMHDLSVLTNDEHELQNVTLVKTLPWAPQVRASHVPCEKGWKEGMETRMREKGDSTRSS